MIKKILILLFLFILTMSKAQAIDYISFSTKLGYLESRNNYKAVNKRGYLGKYQFGGLALIDLGYKDKNFKWTCKDNICSKNDFLINRKVQEKALFNWLFILKKYLKSKKMYAYVGKRFKGILITEEGLLASSHLVGAGAVSKMLRTGKIPKDGNNVKATKYLKTFSGK